MSEECKCSRIAALEARVAYLESCRAESSKSTKEQTFDKICSEVLKGQQKYWYLGVPIAAKVLTSEVRQKLINRFKRDYIVNIELDKDPDKEGDWRVFLVGRFRPD